MNAARTDVARAGRRMICIGLVMSVVVEVVAHVLRTLNAA